MTCMEKNIMCGFSTVSSNVCVDDFLQEVEILAI